MKHTRNLIVRMAGLSLVELMISMTLGLATVGAIGWVYFGATRTYRAQDSIARLQEGARYAFEVIARDLRMTGTTGCGTTGAGKNVITNYDTRWYTNPLEFPLRSREKDAMSPDPLIQNSDALSILRADISTEHIVQNHNSGSGRFTFAAGHTIPNGELMLATDCKHVAVFQATGVTSPTLDHTVAGSPGNSTQDLGTGGAYTFDPGSRVYRLHAATYYIADNPAGVPSLYRERPLPPNATPTAEELVEGVEDLQVSYAVDTDATADGEANFLDPDGDDDPYLTADQVEAIAVGASVEQKWQRVVSVRISLLMRTIDDNVFPADQSYTYNGANAVANDRRLRKVFTHVVKLRNR